MSAPRSACGTMEGCMRHRHHGEPLCEACEPVWAAWRTAQWAAHPEWHPEIWRRRRGAQALAVVPPRREGRTVTEARILLAHHSGDPVLGGAPIAEAERAA